MMKQKEALENLMLPVVESLGLTWVGLQLMPQGKHSILRLFIDKAKTGVSLEDCEKVSRRLNALLSVDGAGLADYTLEVSSPGVDRLLFTPAQCAEQIGKQVSVRLLSPLDGRRNFKGRLSAVEDDELQVELEDAQQELVQFTFAAVKEARLVPEW